MQHSCRGLITFLAKKQSIEETKQEPRNELDLRKQHLTPKLKTQSTKKLQVFVKRLRKICMWKLAEQRSECTFARQALELNPQVKRKYSKAKAGER